MHEHRFPSLRVPKTVWHFDETYPYLGEGARDCEGRENPGHGSLRATVRTAESILCQPGAKSWISLFNHFRND